MKVSVQFVTGCSPVCIKLRYSFNQAAVHILSSGGPVNNKQQTRCGTLTILENQ